MQSHLWGIHLSWCQPSVAQQGVIGDPGGRGGAVAAHHAQQGPHGRHYEEHPDGEAGVEDGLDSSVVLGAQGKQFMRTVSGNSWVKEQSGRSARNRGECK